MSSAFPTGAETWLLVQDRQVTSHWVLLRLYTCYRHMKIDLYSGHPIP